MSYSLSNAAAACGVYKSTVLRSIRAGRLTATKDALGQWRIEPAELHRVYPPVQRNEADGNRMRHGATAALIEAQRRAELAEQRLADLKAVLEDIRQDRDHWRVHAGRLAIADARAATVVATPRRLANVRHGSMRRDRKRAALRRPFAFLGAFFRLRECLRLPLPAPAEQT